MSKIVVLNVGIEHTMGRPTADEWLARSSMRQAWFADAGDIIVSPLPLPEGAVGYLADTLGFAASSVRVITRDEVVTDELLLAPDVLDELRDAMAGQHAPWSVTACFITRGIAQLVRTLGIDPPPGLPFAAQRGSDLVSRKSHFRQLLAGAGLPLVDGCVVESAERLRRALHELLPLTGAVIVKRDDGAGGGGNVILSRDGGWLPGAARTQRLTPDEVDSASAELWEELADIWSPMLVVEAYHIATHRFYYEYAIEDGARPAEPAHGGTIRTVPDPAIRTAALVGIGLDLPIRLPASLLDQARDRCGQVADLMARIGYRGILNIDGILTEDGEVVCNEANARWGGGTVLHDIATRLLGAGYAETHALSSVRELPAAPLPQLVDRITAAGLAYHPGNREGVVVLACDAARSKSMECLVIGAGRQRERAIEAELFALLEQGSG